MDHASIVLDARYPWLLGWAVLVQPVLLLVGVLASNFGETLHSFLIASAAFWAAVVVRACRRPSRPTGFDVIFLRHGLLLLSLACWIGMAALKVS